MNNTLPITIALAAVVITLFGISKKLDKDCTEAIDHKPLVTAILEAEGLTDIRLIGKSKNCYNYTAMKNEFTRTSGMKCLESE